MPHRPDRRAGSVTRDRAEYYDLRRKIHTQHPAGVTGCDFEAYPDRSEIFHQRMSGVVLNSLQLLDNWRMDCEMRSE